MRHNGDDAGAPDRASREFERVMAASIAWVLSDVSSSATTTVSAVLRAELHLARDRLLLASFRTLLLSALLD